MEFRCDDAGDEWRSILRAKNEMDDDGGKGLRHEKWQSVSAAPLGLACNLRSTPGVSPLAILGRPLGAGNEKSPVSIAFEDGRSVPSPAPANPGERSPGRKRVCRPRCTPPLRGPVVGCGTQGGFPTRATRRSYGLTQTRDVLGSLAAMVYGGFIFQPCGPGSLGQSEAAVYARGCLGVPGRHR